MRSRSHNIIAQTSPTSPSPFTHLLSSREEKSGQLSPRSNKSDVRHKNSITFESSCPTSSVGTTCPGELVNTLLSSMGWGVMLYRNHRYHTNIFLLSTCNNFSTAANAIISMTRYFCFLSISTTGRKAVTAALSEISFVYSICPLVFSSSYAAVPAIRNLGQEKT